MSILNTISVFSFLRAILMKTVWMSS